ncbi:MFS transporter [Nocardiopsis kunsanensis]|uniref:MFS transporter n=1 Tax=Nocardiopsis kunsanensis TaxID=141693 RepID=A0A918XEZ9_9ACTN|nr:MFS transporter [Nocardiopsis kunsanensis]GHD27837.1 MFS transporter [Nocardiopsis kunsanensis]
MKARPLLGLVVAQSLAYAGTRLAMIALPWFVLQTTGSPAHMGVVTAVEMGSYGTARLLGGPIMDRIGHRTVGVWADAAAALALLGVPLLHQADLLSFPLLLVLVMLVGLSTGPAEAAKVSLTPFVAEVSGAPMERVTGLTGTVGPVVAGAVVAAAGVMPAFHLTAALMLSAALVLLFFVPLERPGTDVHADPEAGAGYPERLRTGWTAVWSDVPLRVVVCAVLVMNIIDVTVSTVILPVWVDARGHGPGTVGLIAGVMGATAVAGAALAAWLGHRLPRVPTLVAALLVSGAPRLTALALDLPLWAVLVVWGVGGFGSGFVNPILSVVILERLPRHVVGRGMAMTGALTRLGVPLGAPVLGALVGIVGTAPVLLGSAVVYALIATVPANRRISAGIARCPSGNEEGPDGPSSADRAG